MDDFGGTPISGNQQVTIKFTRILILRWFNSSTDWTCPRFEASTDTQGEFFWILGLKKYCRKNLIFMGIHDWIGEITKFSVGFRGLVEAALPALPFKGCSCCWPMFCVPDNGWTFPQNDLNPPIFFSFEIRLQVLWLVVWNIFSFPCIGEKSSQLTFIFFRVLSIPPTSAAFSISSSMPSPIRNWCSKQD